MTHDEALNQAVKNLNQSQDTHVEWASMYIARAKAWVMIAAEIRLSGEQPK